MGWEDRPYYRDRGANSNRLTALLSGSVPLFRAFGIRVRAHNSLLIFILLTLLLGRTQDYDLRSASLSMAILFVVILLHEFGHCFAARSVDGTAEEILLWPLGGLAFPDTPHNPRARFWTVLWGPLTNVLICIFCAAAVYMLAQHHWVSFNPFKPLPPLGIEWHNASFYFWWTFVISYTLLLFNLLPIFPLDGGQMVQTLLWRITGYHRSMLISCMVGMCASAGLAIFAISLWNSTSLMLFVVATCLFLSCYQQRMIVRENGPSEPWQTDDPGFSSSLYQEAAPRRRKVSKRVQRLARKRAMQAVADRKRLDTILAKVSATGLHSLTWRERRVLRIATELRRRQEMELKSILEEK